LCEGESESGLERVAPRTITKDRKMKATINLSKLVVRSYIGEALASERAAMPREIAWEALCDDLDEYRDGNATSGTPCRAEIVWIAADGEEHIMDEEDGLV
jgi:hypothetical protein